MKHALMTAVASTVLLTAIAPAFADDARAKPPR